MSHGPEGYRRFVESGKPDYLSGDVYGGNLICTASEGCEGQEWPSGLQGYFPAFLPEVERLNVFLAIQHYWWL
jgi:hypothetical protein